MKIVMAAGLLLLACTANAFADDTIHDGYESGSISASFVACKRPENTIEVSTDHARHGTKSLRLTINRMPLFTPGVHPFALTLNPEVCVLPGEKDRYLGDFLERAELWEDQKTSPNFGDDTFYGFSMWIDPPSVPAGDFNRFVTGQWKGKGDDSPFLAQRFTGGFYHVTLDVDAKQKNGNTDDPGNDCPCNKKPLTCKVLLAFAAGAPTDEEPQLALDRPPVCEDSLAYPGGGLVPIAPPTIKRFAYLPTPFGTWTDLVFEVKGGKDGVVRIWANGKPIVEATGAIGHNPGQAKTQYFKFGPYRDPASYAATVYLDDLSRGKTREAVDPANFPH